MAKTPSNDLFVLIKSLTPSEKRYFKIFVHAEQQQDSLYLLLFDAIERQDAFDDAALMRALYGTDQLQSRKYSELKAYLYDLILRSLQQYDYQSSIDAQLKNYLQQTQVLYKRSLFSQARKLLRKAYKVAQKYERFGHLLEILQWEKQIAYTTMDVPFFDSALEDIEKEEEEYLQKAENYSHYRSLFYRLYLFQRKNANLRSEEKLRKLDALVKDPLMEDPKKALSFKARVCYLHILNLYQYATLDFEAFYQSGKKMISLLESRPALLKQDVTEYIAAVNNFTLSCGLLGRFEEVREGLAKMKEIRPVTQDDALKVHRQYYSTYFALCISTGAFEEGYEAMQDHLEEVARFGRDQFDRNPFLSQYFYLSFGIGDYNQALDYLNRWVSLPQQQGREDLQAVARIMELLLHYEMDNYQLLESLLRSSYRSLKRKNRLFEFEQSFLQFIRKSVNAPSRTEQKALFQQLRSQLSDLKEKPSEKVIFQHFDFEAWLDSKVRGISFAQAVQDKQPGS